MLKATLNTVDTAVTVSVKVYRFNKTLVHWVLLATGALVILGVIVVARLLEGYLGSSGAVVPEEKDWPGTWEDRDLLSAINGDLGYLVDPTTFGVRELRSAAIACGLSVRTEGRMMRKAELVALLA